MVCKMAKKGLLVTGLGAGLLALLFGTSAPSYVRTAFHRVRHAAHDSVPVQFEIDRARQQVAELEPAIHKNIEEIAKAEVEIEHLQREIDVTVANLANEKETITNLLKQAETGPVKLTRGRSVSLDEVKGDLARRFNHYKTVEGIVADKERTLELRKQALDAAREQNARMRTARAELLTQIEKIETRIKQIEATHANNDFALDDSALARAKATISDLEKRVEVMARVSEQEGRFSEEGLIYEAAPGQDVIEEIHAKFGTCPSSRADTTTDGRSL